jgi:hypothetical protein
MVQAFVDEGIASDTDEAANMLRDMGEIDDDDHESLLSDDEAERIYG